MKDGVKYIRNKINGIEEKIRDAEGELGRSVTSSDHHIVSNRLDLLRPELGILEGILADLTKDDVNLPGFLHKDEDGNIGVMRHVGDIVTDQWNEWLTDNNIEL